MRAWSKITHSANAREFLSLSFFPSQLKHRWATRERERARGGRTDKAHTAAEIEEMRAPKSPLSPPPFLIPFSLLSFHLVLF